MSVKSWNRGLAALVALAVCSCLGTAHAQTKIAVVDLRGAVMQTEDGLRVELGNAIGSHAQVLSCDIADGKAELASLSEGVQKLCCWNPAE